jgi:hypothetical protein
MFRGKFLLRVVAAAAALLVGAATAEAGFLLTVSQAGGPSKTFDLTDTDSSGSENGVSWSGFGIITTQYGSVFAFQNLTVGNYSLANGKFSMWSWIAGGRGEWGELELDTLDVVRTGSNDSPLTIRLTATGFTQPQGTGYLRSEMDALFAAGNTTGRAQLSSWVGTNTNPSDPLPGATNTVGPSSYINTTLSTGTFNLSEPYAITNQITVSNMQAGTNSMLKLGRVDSQVHSAGGPAVAAPAPAGLVLVATAAPFLGLLGRRLRRKDAQVA